MWMIRSRFAAGLVALACLLPAGSASSAEKRSGSPEDPRSKDRVLLDKLGTGDLGPFAARWAGIGREEIRRERERETALRKAGRSVQAEATQWSPLGPAGMALAGAQTRSTIVSGLVADLRVHPSDPKTIWIGTAGGGVWKTTDGGQNWFAKMDDLGRMQIGAVAVSKSDPRRVYAGSGCGDNSNDVQNFPGLGLLVSDDGGEKWRPTASGNEKTGKLFWELDVDPADRDVVLAAAEKGLLRSEDGGDSWVVKVPVRAMSLSRSRSDPRYVYAAVWDGSSPSALWRSETGGKEWVPAGEAGLPGPAELRGRAEIAVAPSDPLRVYVLYSEMGKSATKDTTLDLAVSVDGGKSWTSSNLRGKWRAIYDAIPAPAPPDEKQSWEEFLGEYILGTQGGSFSAMAVDPDNPDVVWAGGLDLWKSTDGGKNFAAATTWQYPSATPLKLPFVHADQHAYVFDGKTLYVGTDGGLFRTTDGGLNFDSLNKGLAITQPVSLCGSAGFPAVLAGGAQDNGPMLRSGSDWVQTSTGDGMGCLVDPRNSKVVHVSTQNEVIQRSSDGGVTWEPSYSERTKTGLTDAGTNDGFFTTVLARHPTSPSTLYTFSQKRLWVTVDNGSVWKTNTKALPGAGGTFLAMHVFPTDGSRVVLATNTPELVETQDQGANWNVLSSSPGSFPVYEVASAVRYDRRDQKWLWLTFGSTKESSKRIWRTTNRGATWEALPQTGLPDVPVLCLEQDPDDPKVWWAGTFVGLYRSGNDGTTWARHGFGLPNTIVMAIDFFRPEKKVRVASFGRSYWEAPTASAPAAPTAEITFPSASTTVEEGTPLTFQGKGTSGDPSAKLTLSWSWDDKTQDTEGENPTHTFWWRGTYTVVLTVTDSWGSKATATRIVTVNPGSSPGGGKAKLQGGRVEVDVTYRDASTSREAAATPQPQADSFAFFSFTDPANPEVFVKVLDFGPSRPYLLFWGGLTSYEYVVRFTVPATGKSASFVVAERSFKGGADTTSLPQALGGGAAFLSRDGETVTPLRGGFSRYDELREVGRLLDSAWGGSDAAGAAVPFRPDAGELSLSGGNVAVSVAWSDPGSGRSGQATPIPKGDAFGYFWFSEQVNPEVFVKVLDFGADRPYLLFWAGLTNFQYTVTFRNVKTGKTAVFNKAAGSYDGGADTTSLPH